MKKLFESSLASLITQLVKEFSCNAGDPSLDSWVGNIC